MLSKNQQAVLDSVKIDVNRHFHYERTHDGNDDANLTLELDDGEVCLHGTCQTVDELEYAVARLIAAFRKEVSHGKVQPDRTLAWKA